MGRVIDDTAKNRLVSISIAAIILGVSIDTVRKWEKAGKIAAYRVNGKRYFSIKELRKLKSSWPMTINEVAVTLNLSVATVRRYADRGILISERKSNGTRIFTRKTIQEFLCSPFFLERSTNDIHLCDSCLRIMHTQKQT